jgi:hypothetical protein
MKRIPKAQSAAAIRLDAPANHDAGKASAEKQHRMPEPPFLQTGFAAYVVAAESELACLTDTLASAAVRKVCSLVPRTTNGRSTDAMTVSSGSGG